MLLRKGSLRRSVHGSSVRCGLAGALVLASRSAEVMGRRSTARDMERAAAALPLRLRRPPAPLGAAFVMLARRGLRPSLARSDLPVPSDISAETADALVERLGHYASRLFVRGVIHLGDGFTPDERRSYVSVA